MMIRVSLFMCALIACCSAFKMTFHDCGSHGGTVQAVVADHCTANPCAVHRGQNYTGYVNFTATKDAQEVHAVLHGGLSIFSLPWHVVHPNACTYDLTCPLQAGHTYQYKLDMPVPSIAPKGLHVTGKWELKDQHGNNILCFAVPLHIE